MQLEGQTARQAAQQPTAPPDPEESDPPSTESSSDSGLDREILSALGQLLADARPPASTHRTARQQEAEPIAAAVTRPVTGILP